MSPRQHELHLDAELANQGPRALDTLAGEFPIRSLLGPEARPDGLIKALVQGPHGEEFDSIKPFIPGYDDGTNIDIPATLIDGVPQARRMLDRGSPNTLHVLLDIPERLHAATGDYSPRSVATYTLALCGHMAIAAGADMKVYRNDGENAGLMFEGHATDLYSAFNQLDGKTRRRDVQATSDTSLNGILKIARSHIDPQENVAVVISDFLDGYDSTEKQFDWEKNLRLMEQEMDDRLRAVRLLTRSQLELPMGMSDLLSITSIQDINSSFRVVAEEKDARIVRNLRRTPTQEIEMFRDDQAVHPVRELKRFVVGTSLE